MSIFASEKTLYMKFVRAIQVIIIFGLSEMKQKKRMS